MTEPWKQKAGRLIPLFALVAVGLLALTETVVMHFQAGPPASKEDWIAAARFVRKEFRRGDLLLFVPRWIDPVGRLHLGDLLTLDQVSRPDEDTYSRIWVVGLAGRRFPLPDRLHPQEDLDRRFGNIEVRRYGLKADEVVYDFYDKVIDARVRLVNDQGRLVQDCPWSPRKERHQCKAGWNNVRQKLAEIDYRLRRCIYAHPHEGLRLQITYPAAALGNELVVYTGLDNYASRHKARKAVLDARKRNPRSPKARLIDVTMKVFVDDRPAATIAQPIDERWHRHVLSTSPKENALVRFEVTTKNAYGKVFCFFAQARSTRADR